MSPDWGQPIRVRLRCNLCKCEPQSVIAWRVVSHFPSSELFHHNSPNSYVIRTFDISAESSRLGASISKPIGPLDSLERLLSQRAVLLEPGKKNRLYLPCLDGCGPQTAARQVISTPIAQRLTVLGVRMALCWLRLVHSLNIWLCPASSRGCRATILRFAGRGGEGEDVDDVMFDSTGICVWLTSVLAPESATCGQQCMAGWLDAISQRRITIPIASACTQCDANLGRQIGLCACVLRVGARWPPPRSFATELALHTARLTVVILFINGRSTSSPSPMHSGY